MSDKGNEMKALTEKELDLLEALMLKEARAKKAGKRLELKERVKLAVLKRALKRQVEETGVWDDAPGDTFPNEDTSEGGFDTDAIGDSEDTINMKQTTLVDPKYANGKHSNFESKKADQIKALEEKIAKLKAMKEDAIGGDDFGGEEDGFGEEFGAEDDLGLEGEGAGGTEQAVADALRGAADALAPEVDALGDEGLGGDELMGDAIGGDEDLDDVMESVRKRAKARREKLAQIRKNRLGEENTDVGADSPEMASQPDEEELLGVYDNINGQDGIVSKHGESAQQKAKRVEAIKKRIADRKAQQEAEVKTYGWNGTPKTNEPAGKRPWNGVPKDGNIEGAPAGFPDNSKASKKGLTEKLDFDALLKKGILG